MCNFTFNFTNHLCDDPFKGKIIKLELSLLKVGIIQCRQGQKLSPPDNLCCGHLNKKFN
jgi:hypothetical protein